MEVVRLLPCEVNHLSLFASNTTVDNSSTLEVGRVMAPPPPGPERGGSPPCVPREEAPLSAPHGGKAATENEKNKKHSFAC
jgi:hypothetical protein